MSAQFSSRFSASSRWGAGVGVLAVVGVEAAVDVVEFGEDAVTYQLTPVSLGVPLATNVRPSVRWVTSVFDPRAVGDVACHYPSRVEGSTKWAIGSSTRWVSRRSCL